MPPHPGVQNSMQPPPRPRFIPSRCCAGSKVQFQFSRAESNRPREGHQTHHIFFLLAIISDHVSSHLTINSCGDGTLPPAQTSSSLVGGGLQKVHRGRFLWKMSNNSGFLLQKEWFLISNDSPLSVKGEDFFLPLLLVHVLGFSKALKDNSRLKQMLYQVI